MKIHSLEDLRDALRDLRCEFHYWTDDDDAIDEFSDLLDEAEEIVRDVQRKQEV